MQINGKQLTLSENMSLSDFLKKEGFCIERVAVEKNGNIVPKKDFDTEQISDNDKIEVVQFVGGG